VKKTRECFYVAMGVFLLLALGSVPLDGARGGKEILVDIGFGDQVAHAACEGQQALLSIDRFHKLLQEYKQEGVDKVLFRIDVLRWVNDFDWPEPNVYYKGVPQTPEEKLHLEMEEKQWAGAHYAVAHHLLKAAVDLAHQEGMQIYAYSTTFDEGMPLDKVWYAPGEHGKWDVCMHKPFDFQAVWRSPLISKFTDAHPEYVMVDRSQKHHNWGTLEFAYPEARAYVVEYNRRFLEEYPFDGIYIDFRNEFSHPAFGDEFGFAPPIVAAYQKRYGVDILHQQFDLEKWRRLCGEYLTKMIQELHSMAHAKGKKLIVAIPQGNYLGLPNGNMYVDWQGWVKDRLVDGLAIGSISGTFLFPDRIGYGYLTDMQTGKGLPNLLWDLQNNYWPLCAAHHVKLYVLGPGLGVKPALPELLKTNVDGIYTGLRIVKQIPR